MRISRVLIFLVSLFSTVVIAAESAPHMMIEDTISKMTARIERERERLKEDPVYARKVVREELGDKVDFKRITRLVMDQHFDKATREQKYRFLDVFRDSLIATYSSGMTLYEGQQIIVLPGEPGDVVGNKARVRTEIRTSAGRIIPVFFSLYRSDSGNWLVENVIVNGLNLGKTFRSQFDQAMQQYQGDLDQVIANWSSELDVDPTAEGAQPADGA